MICQVWAKCVIVVGVGWRLTVLVFTTSAIRRRRLQFIQFGSSFGQCLFQIVDHSGGHDGLGLRGFGCRFSIFALFTV